MKTHLMPAAAPMETRDFWPAESVLAMNALFLTYPGLDVQRWFEEQVALRLTEESVRPSH
ncbi:hypothetical protein [Prosthecobacter sp.]|uniref:hypothetical protein n=1 Tax=Prosthecobacter sp. TaxID=1965333 RepID=UPI002AB82666|nr:hypothetical protein [Prosthecobacter sp.]MDZ4401740.1 hypothetical protein [Prosthecobacter sp.]